ncbi:MAG TPA: CAP domain-containing protein, partial [Tepidiformaceae bacterium]|nr:CAP domain-containing protein [Tepidiformaceae bacterium]
MPHHRPIPLLAAAAALAIISLAIVLRSAPQAAQALTNCDAPADVNTGPEQDLLNLMNQARTANGAVALKLSPNLQRAALWKSADSSAYGPGFSHTDSLGRDTVSDPPNNRALDCGYSTYAAEDIGWGFATAQDMFTGFMNSPGHRANILDPNSVVAGVALIYQGGVPCWTIDFGAVDDSGSGSLPSSAPRLVSTSTPTSTPTAAATPSPTPAPGSQPAHSVTLDAGINVVTFEGPSESVSQA